MTQKPKSVPNGALSAGTTVPLRVTPSTNAELPLDTLATSASTAKVKSLNGFPPTPNLSNDPNVIYSRIVRTFAAKLGELVEWRKLALADGREVLALCFPLGKWVVTDTNALVPLVETKEAKC